MSYLNILTREEQAGRGTPTEKFWPAMLHHAYSVLNKVSKCSAMIYISMTLCHLTYCRIEHFSLKKDEI